MARDTNRKAVIYCRVSDAKQKIRGNGLDSQETLCREYARGHGHEVVRVFKEDISGRVDHRPEMKAMIAYLHKNRKDGLVVIIDDISRLARGVKAHIRLREQLEATGATLESPNIIFGDDSDSQLIEYLLASVSQHQRQKNAEQTKNRMRARSLNGFWVFQAPIGYRYERSSGGGKILVKVEPLASILKEALEGFATGRFSAPVEVKRFLESFPEFPVRGHGEVVHQRIRDILTQPLYAGYLELPKWDIGIRKAQHDGLISFETFLANQDRLNEKVRVVARKDINVDFPLRGFVACGDCGKPLTACWSKGKTDIYPYYLCRTRGCDSANKSVSRAKVEGAFEQLLKTLTPSEDLFALAAAIFRDLWDQRLASASQQKKTMAAELSQIDRKIAQLLDRIVDADSETVIKAYEKRVQEYEARKLILAEKIANCGRPIKGYDESFRTSLEFLENAQKLWVSERLEDKRAVLKLAFAGHLSYQRNEGFRTPEISLPFKALDGFLGPKKAMAHLGGEDLKLLFKVLAEWNHALSYTSIASDIAPANGNAPHGTVKSLESQLERSACDNVIGVDLSVRRPPRPTDRSPKVRVPNDDSVEAGHG